LVFRESYNETCIPIVSQGSGQVLCLIVKKKLGTKLKAFVTMNPSLAASNEKNLQIAFVGKIIEPYLWNNENSSIKDVLSGIYFELEEIICLNPKTGQQWKVDLPTKTNNTTSKPNSTKTEVTSLDEEALAQFKKTLISEPMNAEAYLGIGKIYSKRGDYDLAIPALQQAIFWNNQLIDAHIELGRIYFIKGECKLAESFLKSALELDNQNPFALGLKRLVEKC
jgi:tetratricopeptide (TPR) repeat protein